MKKTKLVKSELDGEILELVKRTDHKILGVWAADCTERVLPYFEKKYPKDKRPRAAIEDLRKWIVTGIFKMTDIRRVALASHAAAREVAEDDVAQSVARAAGQALATAHVKTHSAVAAIYAATAVRDANDLANAVEAVNKERQWQYQHLIKLRNNLGIINHGIKETKGKY